MKLRPKNQNIELSGENAIKILRQLNVVLLSLRNIGSYYAIAEAEGGDAAAYEHETTKFIDRWRVTARLAEARAILDNCFDSTIGEDDMGDVERELELIERWTEPGSAPPSNF